MDFIIAEEDHEDPEFDFNHPEDVIFWVVAHRLALEIEDGLVTSNIGACKAILNGLEVALTNPIYNG